MKRKRTLHCRVAAHNFSPKGKVEGLLVEAAGRTSQVVFPHRAGINEAGSIAVGQMINLVVKAGPFSSKGEVSHPIYRFISIAKAEKARRVESPNSSPIAGIVTRLNYARHGEPNGVVLDSGNFIHLKPDGMREMQLKIGDRVEAEGDVRQMELGGLVVEATVVNGVQLATNH